MEESSMTVDIRPRPTRRLVTSALVGGAGLMFLAQTRFGRALADTFLEEIEKLKPGQFTWHPERSPDGPVAIIVSLPTQLCHVYRNGIRIAVSTVSTGRPTKPTPTGVFTILEKARTHYSSTYDEASMPNMERLTWSGVALHAGGLPGYPSSHGCVHLPLAFSAELYTITQVGTPVIIAGANTEPVSVIHPGLVLGQYAETEFKDIVAKEVTPPAGDQVQHTSIIVSSADRGIDVLVNGDVIVHGVATIDGGAATLGSNVFILSATNADAKGIAWHAIGYSNDGSKPVADPNALIRRIHADDAVIDAIKQRMVPGTVLVTTDLPMMPDTRTGKDFVVMSTGEA
jgi:hypothetical protein